jgi:hypothetical protein
MTNCINYNNFTLTDNYGLFIKNNIIYHWGTSNTVFSGKLNNFINFPSPRMIDSGRNHSIIINKRGRIKLIHATKELPSNLNNLLSNKMISSAAYHSYVILKNDTLNLIDLNDAPNDLFDLLRAYPKVPVRLVAAGDKINLAVGLDNNVYAWGEINNVPDEVKANASNILMIACGAEFACVLLNDKSCLFWGNKTLKGIIKNEMNNNIYIRARGENIAFIKSNGELKIFSSNEKNTKNFKNINNSSNVISVTVGYDSVLALDSSGMLKLSGDPKTSIIEECSPYFQPANTNSPASCLKRFLNLETNYPTCSFTENSLSLPTTSGGQNNPPKDSKNDNPLPWFITMIVFLILVFVGFYLLILSEMGYLRNSKILP